MTDYSKMSDFEINCLVAKGLGITYAFWFPESEDDFDQEIPPNQRGPIWQTREYVVNGYRPSNGNFFNPCNSWADAGPIIEKHGIELGYDGVSWEASCNLRGIKPYSDWKKHPESPCRLAMIVYLMMQESVK